MGSVSTDEAFKDNVLIDDAPKDDILKDKTKENNVLKEKIQENGVLKDKAGENGILKEKAGENDDLKDETPAYDFPEDETVDAGEAEESGSGSATKREDTLLEVTFTEETTGSRIDSALRELLPEYSRNYIRELIDEGRVRIGQKAVKASRKVTAGEKAVIEIPAPKPLDLVPEPMDLKILYEDEDLLIVDKPKGLTVHPAPGHETGTLVHGILAHCGENLSGINGVLRPGIVHRIDKDTSGALIICKNDSTHRDIAAQLKEHSITRRYRGVVIGSLPKDDGTIEGNIGRNPYDRKRMSVMKEGGKPAVTHYHVLQRFSGYTYCEFSLETGRTHQIRVHMASIGHPLLGDPVYGPTRQAYHLEGQALHAMVIGFIHPRTGEYVSFTAPLPDYFTELLKKLEHRS